MARRVDKVERVANLMFTLLHTKEPLSLVEIGAQVPGYPPGGEALRTQFERDKRTLRDSGIPITVGQPNSSAQDGYQILAADYYLPDLALTDAEQHALALALAIVRLDGTQQAEIAVKIGASPETAPLPVMVLPSASELGRIGQAIRTRTPIHFSYHGRARDVEPHSLVFHAGSWYLVGHDAKVSDGGRRTYRVDRIDGKIALGEPESFDPPEYDPTTELTFSLRAPSFAGADPERVVLAVQAVEVANVIGLLGRDVVRARDRDDNATVEFALGDEDAVTSWILGLGDAVEVVAPPSLRERVVGALVLAATGTSAALPEIDVDALVWTAKAESTPKGHGHALDAGARLRRMIALLTYLAQEGSAPIAELARRFDAEPETIVAELELAACLGVPPYTPDELLEIVVDTDRVYVHELDALARPLRLTPDEGFALAIAARTLLQVGGVDVDSALATGLGKLEEVLGHDRVHVDVDAPSHLDVLRKAAAANRIVEINYRATSTGESSTRRIEPVAVVLREGQFYVDAYCHRAEGWRRFRVANITDVTVTDQRGEPRHMPAMFGGPNAFVGDGSVEEAVIVLPEHHQVLVEHFLRTWPIPLGDGRVLVRLPVASARWLGHLLLRLGDEAAVLTPPRLRQAGAIVARNALLRYDRVDTG